MQAFFRGAFIRGVVPFVLFAMSACGTGATAAGPQKSNDIGLGGDCDGVDKLCRSGLTCTSGKCAAAGTTKEGDPCTIGAECASGVCGPVVSDGATTTPATCAPAGGGKEGDGCAGDADCGKGLRCGFDGASFFPHCVKEGTADVGGACSKNTDCLQGLVCSAGVCGSAVVPPGLGDKGVPPYIPSPGSEWPGATCDDDVKGGITALFHVPRASDAPSTDFYRLPFPNDAARDKATGKVSFANHPHDDNPAMGFDAVKLYLDALESEPFGNYPTVFFRFDGQFTFESVVVTGDDPQTRIVDLTDGPTFGQRQGILVFVTNGRNKYICQNYVAVRPQFGAPLQPGHTYGVIMKKGVTTCASRDKDGKCTPGDAAKVHPDFAAMVAASAPADAGLKDAYTAYAPLRKWMDTAKVPADQLLVASVFTVGDPTKVASRLRASVRATIAPKTDEWVKCGAGVKSPCPQSDDKDGRACGTDNPDFDEYHSLVEVPVFQQGSAPYLSSKDGGAIDSVSTTIAPTRTEKVCAALTIPKGTAPASGWPIAIYAHGTGGSFKSHVNDGSAQTLSKIDLGGGTTYGFAVLGIDQVQHGTRRGASTMSPNDLFFNFANPAAARYNAQQGAADQHTLVRLAETLTLPAAKLDGTKIVYWGHSQGATEGAIFLANDTSIKGAVLSGEGASLIDALLGKTKPVDIKDAMWIALSESGPKAVDLWHPVLSLLQSWADPADPLNYAALDVKTPNGMTPYLHNVFQPFGVKEDTYTPWATQMSYALAGGLAFVGPGPDAHGFATVMSAQGNVVVGSAKATAAMRQYTAAAGKDGHFVAFDVDEAKADLAKFLARSARGETPKIPE